MTRTYLVLGAIAVAAAASAEARAARHQALPPVPQAAQIAALNRESLAKIKPVPAHKKPAATSPAGKKPAHRH